MAFVRRVRAKTRIELMELASGKVRTLAEGVERDNQEGFAFHGVFPGFSWTPDGKRIVATADGKLFAWSVDSGTRTAIPFHARVEQRVTDAARFPHRIGRDAVRARIVRWPVESPDGKRLVFSALGHLYAMDLPSGEPKRLTRSDDLEYAPAFSADGRRLAFVTWNDRDGGNVFVAEMSAGGLASPRRLTEAAGQYANPSFSADGSKVVYVRGSGATFRDEDLGNELWEEIHWVSAAGGPSTFVIGTQNRGTNRRMSRPVFSPEGDRILYLEDDAQEKPAVPPKSVLAAVKLDGTDRRIVLRFNRAEEAVVSPDGRWVVFNEQHNAWVTALPQVGKDPVEAGLDNGALPVAKLTDEGGEWVNWADGGKTLTWIFGPVYHRLAFDKAFPPPGSAEAKKEEADKARTKAKKTGDGKDDDAKKEEKKALPKSDAIEIVLSVPRAKPSGVVAYRGARIVTMKGDEVIDRGVIVVEDDRVRAVGAEGKVDVPAGAKVVDVSGRTIIPGLFDEHAHLHYTTLDIFPQRSWKYLANLAYGVTSTHDPSASTQEVFGQSEMVEAGLMVGPRIFSTGFILYGADLPGRALIDSLDDARHHLRRMKSVGAFSVKSYMQPRREQRQWILEAAREEGMEVVPEGGGDLEMDLTMVLDGHTTLEHALPVTPLRNDVITLFGKSTTSYTPTLLVAYGGIFGDQWFFQHYDVWKDEKLLRYVPQGNIDARARIRSVMADDEDWHHIDVAASAKKVMDAGGTICLGAHGQLQGLGPHWEIWAYVQGGMTPLQALRVATINPAKTLGLDADLGSIEPGKLADFVVLEKNPLEKIENTDSVTLVVKNGRAYTPDELKR
jgi:imidazolonepropionase-like amidohydrolase/Tol biopolymer transport system component